ncbi:MAG: 3-hydroxyisobutyryl-CoA hydrolase [Rhizobiales bacterium 65-9]|nr:enoyl-CoA hydratase/isomerase family protein [Hyphomicrobiales bacterium]OJY36943.1 MAG: 3-hydroxyisobutyryl-CoA hydrolase [Rhizobiales bacterium 65-9]
MTADSDIICERIGAAGVVTLNRPRALNALNLAMVRAMTPALREWAGDPAVTRVVVRGAGDRAFCAGGDIRALYDQGLAGDRESALAFWREEYRLNAMIARYPKPYVSLIDGICMGGGVGLSLHGSHRVAGDRYLFAMPEVGIGFFPDVGATYALPRLPGHAGLWLALTGDRVKAADAVALGLATSRVSSSALPALTDDLIAGRDVQAAIAARAAPAEEGPLAAERSVIDRCFGGASVEETLARLDREASPFAAAAAATIRAKSPTSLKIAFEQMRRGAELDFEAAIALEFRIVTRIIEGRDYYEGVRAVIIDKDNAPRWTPATLDGVSPADVAAYFAPLGPNEWRAA